MLSIKTIREQKGISQAALADMVQVNQTAVSQWERGTAYPSCDKLPALADALGCTIDFLFGRESASA
ncbi:helix-turn-helix transcriptional regulator [Oscillibacter sp.]|uniref:helix-turn-helix domain-containing protein n=1 Tax=Oscillibacter sp. TaxID=1945593 RepID=UPI00289B2E44|nr:helix-turn-helix transcriptional regulator [Oscillibacter sp.]